MTTAPIRPIPLALIGQFLILASLLALPDLALAEPWDTVATRVLNVFNSGLSRSIAIMGVIGCGIAAFFGRLSYQWAINIIIGIVLVFGSASIVDFFKSGLGTGT
jgi:type IV secretion system protein VirB2